MPGTQNSSYGRSSFFLIFFPGTKFPWIRALPFSPFQSVTCPVTPLSPALISLPRSYKCVWEVELVHIATNKTITFGEHKGAAQVTDLGKHTIDQYSDDMIELLNLLCSRDCPHTYDCVVAGSVA